MCIFIFLKNSFGRDRHYFQKLGVYLFYLKCETRRNGSITGRQNRMGQDWRLKVSLACWRAAGWKIEWGERASWRTKQDHRFTAKASSCGKPLKAIARLPGRWRFDHICILTKSLQLFNRMNNLSNRSEDTHRETHLGQDMREAGTRAEMSKDLTS